MHCHSPHLEAPAPSVTRVLSFLHGMNPNVSGNRVALEDEGVSNWTLNQPACCSKSEVEGVQEIFMADIGLFYAMGKTTTLGIILA